jgi:tetratricopeptide (TPR) repeat protein
VESHCFGCERAFEGERAQGIAEKIFTQLAQKTPNKPQVHYLLGYLREEQERPKEALDHYRTAVKLDPDYLNAWHKIAQISAKTVVPADERDNVVFNLLRLSPNRRHGGYRFDTVTDLAGLWARVANTPAATGRTGTGAKLYPLAASKRKLEQQAVERATEDLDIPETMFFSEEREMRATPAAAVTQNGFIQAGALLFQKSRALVE